MNTYRNSSRSGNGYAYSSRSRRLRRNKRSARSKRYAGILIACVVLIAAVFVVSIAGAAEPRVVSQPASGQVDAETQPASGQVSSETQPASGQAGAETRLVSEQAGAETQSASGQAETDLRTAADTAADESAASSENDMFTDRDLSQTADLSAAVYYTVEDEGELHITEEGVYVLSGSAAHAVIYVEAAEEDKVQLVLDGLHISNDSFPCIYVISADKVFITTAGDSSLTVSNAFLEDGDTMTDGVIFSRSDVVLNGTATLTIRSSENGVVSKDDLKITGGIYDITAGTKALEANDSICIADGTLLLSAGTDGVHAENDEDDSLGYIYICGGDFTIQAGDDAIHAISYVQIDGGTLQISAAEGIEGTYIQINDGTISISAWDDGINAANKSYSYTTALEINGGTVTVVMANGDTDGLDSNGNLIINGGTVDVTAGSAVDYDGVGAFNGGMLIVNGQQMTTLPNQMMGGGGSSGAGW